MSRKESAAIPPLPLGNQDPPEGPPLECGVIVRHTAHHTLIPSGMPSDWVSALPDLIDKEIGDDRG